MQPKEVLPVPPQSGVRPPPTPVAPFGSASPLLSPTVRGVGAGDPCTLRPPRLTGNAASASRSPPEDIPCDVPLPADLLRMRLVAQPQLVFRGWETPVKGWKDWVENMAREDKFVKVWRAAGIEDAIFNSTVHIRQSSKVMLALVGFWCPSTCTFVLPWGEAGFTLEDAHVLGNLPVWGSPLQRLLTEEEERLRIRLVEARETLWKARKKSGLKITRVTHACWLEWFARLEDDDELQHLGFLAYWLSRSVVACKPLHEVPSAVFGIAARLSRGERIALAPAVTANIYSDLSNIARSLYDRQGPRGSGGIKIEVWGQLRLVQSWLWERFDCLSPKPHHNATNQHSGVRIARWDNKLLRLSFSEAVKAFFDAQSFAWRPYTNEEAEHWVMPQWYMGEGRSIVVEEHSPVWVYDILAIVSAAALVGLASEHTIPMGQYKPYRVSMQLGYDQAIPTSSGLLVTPWDSCTMCPTGMEFYVPSMARGCSALNGYARWWEDHTFRYALVLTARRDLKQKKRKGRKIYDANNVDNPREVILEDDNMESISQDDVQVEGESVHHEEGEGEGKHCFVDNASVHQKGENQSVHQKGEPCFVEKSAYSTGDPIIEVLDDESPDEYSSKGVSKYGNIKKGSLAGDVKVEHDVTGGDNFKTVPGDDDIIRKKKLAQDIKVEHDVSGGENTRTVTKDGNMKKRRLVGDAKMECDINNYTNVLGDGSTKKRRLPVAVNLGHESVCRGEPDFVKKPTNSTTALQEKAPTVIIIDNEQWEDVKPKDVEHGPPPHKAAGDESDFEDILADELEEFLAHGLQAELMSNVSSSPSGGSSIDRSTKHEDGTATDANMDEDCIVGEVIRRYPRFFNMIPQYPHYLGLLQSNVGAGMKKIVYTSLWYKLVELMQKAIRTTCQTSVCEIEQLTKEARYLEELGFDVRHLIARLKQPERRLKRLSSAKEVLEKVRAKAKEQTSLSNISRTHISNLWKVVKDAEINVLEREWDVNILAQCLNSK